MLERRKIAPYCPITGISCALAPPEQMLSDKSPDTSFHHAQHASARLLLMRLLGRTMRTSRIQLTLNEYHNRGPKAYHPTFEQSYDPGTRMGRCGVVLFNVVNTVPDQVIDIAAAEIRPVTYEERQRLFTSNELRVQSDFIVRRFFTALTLESAAHHASGADMRSYKGSSDDDRIAAANSIIGKLLPFTFKELNDPYNRARDAGLLPESAPQNPAEVARQYIFQEPDRYVMFDDVAFNNDLADEKKHP